MSYDIRDPHRLRAVYHTMLGFGHWMQYSVFVCDLGDIEKIGMRVALRDVIDLAEDSIMIVDLGDAETRGRYCFEFMGVHQTLPMPGGPQIV